LAGLLKRDYAREGMTLATTDVTIAAIAIHHQLILITDKLKHYPMKELSIYPLP
jgi:predicted nucleic acid-binding protein